MISIQKLGNNYNRQTLQIDAMSTDVKPTKTVEGYTLMNGDIYHEMDTNIYYKYDQDTQTWIEQVDNIGRYFKIEDATIDDDLNLIITY